MSKYFNQNGFIQLNNFFEDDISKIKSKILKENFKEEYNPISHRKETLNKKNIHTHNIPELFNYFKSKEFIHLIKEITHLNFRIANIEICKYSHRDFIILNDKIKPQNTIDVIFDLTSDWKKENGGILTYTTKNEELIYVTPNFNTLTLVHKPKEVMKYLKYVNNKAKTNQILRIEIIFNIEETSPVQKLTRKMNKKIRKLL